jgi:CMP-N,N'-diacetyllegionaminic acid synthase
MKPLIVIPARGGSKGIPGKNIKALAGKPLIQYTIDAARILFPPDIIIVSTNDFEIKNIVEKSGLKVPFLRPASLATDTTGTYEVLLHALQFSEESGYFPDTIILLQPTSPFRNVGNIKEAMNLYTDDLDMLVSVKETKANPYYLLFEEDNAGYLKKSKEGSFNRRQDCPKVWEFNGAIYIINISSLKQGPLSQFQRIKKYVMDEISSIDIDNDLDWKIAEAVVASNK